MLFVEHESKFFFLISGNAHTKKIYDLKGDFVVTKLKVVDKKNIVKQDVGKKLFQYMKGNDFQVSF